jgi:hypothetical protein
VVISPLPSGHIQVRWVPPQSWQWPGLAQADGLARPPCLPLLQARPHVPAAAAGPAEANLCKGQQAPSSRPARAAAARAPQVQLQFTLSSPSRRHYSVLPKAIAQLAAGVPFEEVELSLTQGRWVGGMRPARLLATSRLSLVAL